MAIEVVLNGVTYEIPSVGDTGWGTALNAYLIALANNPAGTISVGSPANGLDITTSILTLAAATGSLPGALTATTQTIGGAKTFNAGLISLVASGSDALKLLDGAKVNFSTADSNANLSRTAANVISTPGSLGAGTGSSQVLLNQFGGYLSVGGGVLQWNTTGLSVASGSAVLGFSCATANPITLKSGNIGASGVNVRAGATAAPQNVNATSILFRVGCGFGNGLEVDPLDVLKGSIAARVPVSVLGNVTASKTGIPTNGGFTTASTGGSLAAGTYYYRISARNSGGESLASTETSQVVPAGTSTNTVTVSWSNVPGATGYNVYGRTTGAELLIATVDGGALTYTDTGSITPAGALPTVNTTGAAFNSETAALLTPASANGVSVSFNGDLRTGYFKIVVPYTAWIAAAGSQDLTLAIIPAGCRILSVIMDQTVKFNSGHTNLSVGITGKPEDFLLKVDCGPAEIITGLSDADCGANFTQAMRVQGGLIESWTGNTNLILSATNNGFGGGNFGNGTVTNFLQGSTTVYVTFEVLK